MNIKFPNLHPKPERPYFITAPPYETPSAGVKVLYLLCHALNLIGQKAFIVPIDRLSNSPHLVTPFAPEDYDVDNIIAVYPEIVHGNPLNAKHVVRWLLSYKGFYGGPSSYPETDKIWSYSTGIAASISSNNVLCLPSVDPSIFYPPRKYYRECKYKVFGKVRDGVEICELRYGTCYYAKKYTEVWKKELLPGKQGSPLNVIGIKPEEIANILRSSELCYVYEDTQVILEAKMCGCPVEYIKHDRFQEMHCEKDWDYPFEKIVSNFWDQLDLFVADTQRWGK